MWVYREAEGPPPEYAWPAPRGARRPAAVLIVALVLLIGLAIARFDPIGERAQSLLTAGVETLTSRLFSQEDGARPSSRRSGIRLRRQDALLTDDLLRRGAILPRPLPEHADGRRPRRHPVRAPVVHRPVREIVR